MAKKSARRRTAARRRTTNAPPDRKLTSAQLRDAELSHDVQHVSTDELKFRMRNNAERTDDARLDLIELDAKRKIINQTLTRLVRDRAIMSGVISSRQLTIIGKH